MHSVLLMYCPNVRRVTYAVILRRCIAPWITHVSSVETRLEMWTEHAIQLWARTNLRSKWRESMGKNWHREYSYSWATISRNHIDWVNSELPKVVKGWFPMTGACLWISLEGQMAAAPHSWAQAIISYGQLGICEFPYYAHWQFTQTAWAWIIWMRSWAWEMWETNYTSHN